MSAPNGLLSLLIEGQPGQLIPDKDAETVAAELTRLTEIQVYPASIAVVAEHLLFLGKRSEDKILGILSKEGRPAPADFGCQVTNLSDQKLCLQLCPTDHSNAEALRQVLPYTAPRVLGLRRSVGCGDRLGLATPGHARAVRRFGSIAPIFAQQSVRENDRTGRTPQQVLDDATWGLFQEGWRDPWGADADHLKMPTDADAFVAAGYTLYTIDAGDHVDNATHTASLAEVEAKVQALPWHKLEDTAKDMERRYLGRFFDLGGAALTFDREALWRAAAKYARAIAHTVQMYRHLADRIEDQGFELEVAVDETEDPTSPAEHLFIASELRRTEVRWVSLAPRFVGRFEKGVDYIGDKERFEQEFIKHVAVARYLSPYKLSVHSGSDKFSIYPIIARRGGELVHLKTSGTSYLEALRVVASIDPSLFREILAFALEHYEEERVTYHVSADPSRVPRPDRLADSELPGVLDFFHGRQVLHVTFGSVMRAVDGEGRCRFRRQLLTALAKNEEAYYEALKAHMCRHLALLV